MKLPPIFSLCALFFISGTLYGMEGWMTDLEKAKTLAAEQKKDLFIIYKGSSWRPEQYGVPERMFTCGAVKKHLEERFVLLMQDFPPGHLKKQILFSFNIQGKSSLPDPPSLASGLNEKWRNDTQYVFATAANVPYHVSSQKPTWLRLKTECTAAEKKKNKVLNLIPRIQVARGKEKYRLMGRLFDLTGWSPSLPSSLYSAMREEALLNDPDNLSHTRENNYLRQMQEMAWGMLWYYKSLEFLKSADENLPQDVKSNISPEWSQTLQFTKLICTLGGSLLQKEEKEELGSLEDFLEAAKRKTDQIISEAPSSEAVPMIRMESQIRFLQIYHFASLAQMVSQPGKILEILPGIMNQPWVDEESKQLFGLIKAGCHLKMGKLEEGLALLKTYRDLAPWTDNSKEANDSLQAITERLSTLRELWKKKQAGNEYAAEAYKESTQLILGINWEF